MFPIWKIDISTNFATTADKQLFYSVHLSDVINLTGSDFGRVGPHSQDLPSNFKDVSYNEIYENTSIFDLTISREAVFPSIRF